MTTVVCRKKIGLVGTVNDGIIYRYSYCRIVDAGLSCTENKPFLYHLLIILFNATDCVLPLLTHFVSQTLKKTQFSHSVSPCCESMIGIYLKKCVYFLKFFFFFLRSRILPKELFHPVS